MFSKEHKTTQQDRESKIDLLQDNQREHSSLVRVVAISHFHSFESENQSESLFLSEIGLNFTLNRVENTCLFTLKRVVCHVALCESGMADKTSVFHSFTLREYINTSPCNASKSEILL